MAKKTRPGSIANTDIKIRQLLGDTESTKVNTGLYLSSDLKARIDKAAKAHGTTFNALVVKILEDFFKED
jgi:hypothetical protein